VPLLFIFFINDIVTDIQSTIKLFADDTSLYLIVDDLNETADSLNNDLTKIHDWATKWLVTFNAQKTETMTTFVFKIYLFILVPVMCNRFPKRGNAIFEIE
jgi:hypothetical protein